MSELAKYQLELSKSQAQFVNEIRNSLTNQAAQLRNLDSQIGQMVSIFIERQQGNLLNTSEVNPRRDGKEHCKAIALRSEKIVEKPVQVYRGENSAGISRNNVEKCKKQF